jgi:hypothetical protein
MSFSKIIQTYVDSTIKLYINEVSNKYNIDKNDLFKMWNKDIKEKDDNVTYEPIVEPTSKNTNFSSLSKNELVELCKLKGLKTRGTKAELIETLSQNDSKLMKKSGSKKSNSPQDKSVIKKLVAKIPNIPIKRNKFDNFEHVETSFIFDKDKKVYGKQNPDGTIKPLSKEDIDLCNKYKFSYYIPDNLDKKTSLKDIEVEELDEDVEEDEEVEEDDEVDEELEEEEEFEDEYYEE